MWREVFDQFPVDARGSRGFFPERANDTFQVLVIEGRDEVLGVVGR